VKKDFHKPPPSPNSHFLRYLPEKAKQKKTIIFFVSYQILVTLLKLKIMGRNTSVSLGDYFESFVDNKVSEGRFKNASEVIRAGLRLLESEENKVIILKNAIKEGIESGIAENFNQKKHLESLKAEKRNV
jgi:antitoxin ParD1/3/4